MKSPLKILCCPLVLCLSGCYLNIKFVGPGQVTSTDGSVDCTATCRYNSLSYTNRYLNAASAAGYDFLGFISHNGTFWHAGSENFFVGYGMGVRSDLPTPPGGVPVGAGSWHEDVTAVFWPATDVRQSVITAHSLCLIDQENRLHCWGSSAGRFPSEGLSLLVTDSIGTKSSLCALYADRLQCRNESGNRDWIIPDFITQPIDAVLAMDSLCVLHATDTGNAVFCAARYGADIKPVPPLSNPVELYFSPDRKMCAVDEGQPVCW